MFLNASVTAVRCLVAVTVLSVPVAARADMVTDWNQTALAATEIAKVRSGRRDGREHDRDGARRQPPACT